MTVAVAEQLSGLRKAAIFLVQLGKDKAARVMALLPEAMVEDLTGEIVRLRDVSKRDAESVLAEAHGVLSNQENSARGGLELARQLLAQSVGAERADEIMERLGASAGPTPGSCCPSWPTSTRRRSPWCWPTWHRSSRRSCSPG